MFCVTVILPIVETVTGGLTRMVKGRLTCVGKARLPAPSRTATVIVKSLLAVGVPVMRPLLESIERPEPVGGLLGGRGLLAGGRLLPIQYV